MTVSEETVFFYIFACLSDSSVLSDNLRLSHMLLVRFSRDIGQPPPLPHAACPILPRYRTTCNPSACCLSDSFPVSDNLRLYPTIQTKKAEPAKDSAFYFVLSVLFIFIRRIRLLRHRLKHGSFVLKLNGTRSILR